MSDETTLIKLLREALLYESASNSTHEEVEEFMSAPTDSSPDTLRQMHAQFADRVLGKLHSEPVREIEKGITLGRWIEAVRKKALLPGTFVADALGVDPSFIDRFESGYILPWTILAAKGAEIAILFRIHFKAFCTLTENSYRAKRRLEQLLSSKTQTTRLPPGASAYIILSPDEEISDDIKDWLDAVRRVLEDRQATHLLD